MAKQTFTTGQVLTAAQMESLQQTAMGGGAATAKTASYVLVAADAGTVVRMNAAGATTITVNTSLFAAGDTVYIQNIGAGVCTITAGTATVNTSASLALAQYEGGTLYFTSASAALFFKAAGAPATSGGMTLISTTTLSGSSVSLTSIPQTYIHLQLIIEKYLPSVDGQSMFMRFNANSSANQYLSNLNFTSDVDNSVCDATEMRVTGSQSNSAGLGQITINIPNYTNANTRKFMWATSLFNSNTEASARIDYWQRNGFYLPVEAITGISLRPFNPNFSGGTAYLYGVK